MAREPEVMNIYEAAAFLGVHEQTLRRLARQRKIPCFKIGRDWRFRRGALVRWADAQGERPEEAAPPRALVVDDDPRVARALVRLLGDLGCRASHAASGEAALAMLDEEVPGVVLLDLQMPDMNGPTLLGELRERHGDIPVAIVTGYPDSDLMLEASRHTPVMMIAKPVEREQLAGMLKLVFGRRSGRPTRGGGDGRGNR